MIHFMNLNRVFQKGKSIFAYKINLNFTSLFFILVMILSTYTISYYVITKNSQAVIPNKAVISNKAVIPNKAVSGKDVPKTLQENFTEPIDNGKYDQFIPYRVRNGERKFHHIIRQAAALYQVDPALIKAIILAESGYNPRAISRSGARGLMQLMPRTARALGVRDSFNPEHNIDGGVRYFKQLLNRFNQDVKLALAAYNAGSRKVLKYNGIPPYRATQLYIKKVIKYQHYFKNKITI